MATTAWTMELSLGRAEGRKGVFNGEPTGYLNLFASTEVDGLDLPTFPPTLDGASLAVVCPEVPKGTYVLVGEPAKCSNGAWRQSYRLRRDITSLLGW
jgi:hypothetical protein